MIVPEQKLVQGNFLSWKGLRFLRPLILCNVLNDILKRSCMDTCFISVFPPGEIGVGHGPEARKICCHSRDVGAALHPGRPWTITAMIDLSTFPWRLLSQWSHPGCAKEIFGVEEFSWAWQGRLKSCAWRALACAHQSICCRCVWGCLCLRGRGTAGCSQRFQSSRKTPCHAGELLYLKQGSACDLP